MKKILAFIICISPIYAQCQLYNNPFLTIKADTTDPIRNEVSINSSYCLSSNALNSKFFNSVLFSDFISDADKTPVLKDLGTRNTLGLTLHNDIYYGWQANANNLHLYVDVASRIQFTSAFTPDVYKLLLFGNKQFAGQTAVLSGSSFNEFACQSAQFGFYKYFKKQDGSTFMFGGGLSLVGSGAYAHIDMERGTLFTSTDGDSLAIDAKMTSKSVNAANIITEINGLGASLNIFGAYQFKNKDVIRFQLADLGFVSYNHNPSSLNLDQKISYTGTAIKADSGQFSIGNYSAFFDSVSTVFKTGTSSQSFTVVLPFQVRLMYVKAINPTLSVTGAIEYIHDNIQTPEIFLSAEKVFSSKFSGRAGVSVLGYGSYGINAGAEYHISRKLSIMLGTQHFEGLLPIPDGHGQGYYASLKWRDY